MEKNKAMKIAALFSETKGNEPEKSAEYLFQMTVDRAKQQYGMDIDSSDVAEALFEPWESLA